MNIVSAIKKLPVIIVCIGFLSACGVDYIPKPKTYFRINFPAERNYIVYDSAGSPFKFEYPTYAKVTPDKSANSEPWWFNLEYPDHQANLHVSYKTVTDRETLFELTEDARNFVFKHAVKAEGITESKIDMPGKEGIFYEIDGNTASSIQFFVTDSVNHFMRGSLYFNALPNRDSLNPVIDFITADILHMINTLEWKNSR